jgi:hypothetical protein
LAGLLGDVAGQSGPGRCSEESAEKYEPAGAASAEIPEVSAGEQALSRRLYSDWLAGVGLIALVMVHVYFAVPPQKLDITSSMIHRSMKREYYLKHYDPQRWMVGIPSAGSVRMDEDE